MPRPHTGAPCPSGRRSRPAAAKIHPDTGSPWVELLVPAYAAPASAHRAHVPWTSTIRRVATNPRAAASSASSPPIRESSSSTDDRQAAANEEKAVVVALGMGARDVGVQAFDPRNEALHPQELERPVHGRRSDWTRIFELDRFDQFVGARRSALPPKAAPGHASAARSFCTPRPSQIDTASATLSPGECRPRQSVSTQGRDRAGSFAIACLTLRYKKDIFITFRIVSQESRYPGRPDINERPGYGQCSCRASKLDPVAHRAGSAPSAAPCRGGGRRSHAERVGRRRSRPGGAQRNARSVSCAPTRNSLPVTTKIRSPCWPQLSRRLPPMTR